VPSGDLALPIGPLQQRPPAYSAVKVGGKRAYALARAGIQVELAERPVTVHSFVELWRSGDRRGFEISCSSGTYVRSLIASLGDAYCVELRRTRIGGFSVDDVSDRVIPLNEALSFMPSLTLGAEDAVAAAHGRALAVPAPAGVAGAVRLLDDDGLIALASPIDDGAGLKPIVGFRG
jgi:tRNA pseudouridine55 synthase